MSQDQAKHVQITEWLRTQIAAGRYRQGQRVPSETYLCEQFQVARGTVGRALQQLEQQGVIVRRRGSGSYVSIPEASPTHTFGLLIPNLGETEIFGPICNAIAVAVADRQHRLHWGHFATDNLEERGLAAERLCQQYLDQGIDGLFYAPIEQSSAMNETNARIAQQLQEAGIPVVLLDRDIAKFPERSPFDVVGIDNRRVGYLLTQHFLGMGCRRICFVHRQLSVHTIQARIDGYRAAMLAQGCIPSPPLIMHAATDVNFLAQLLHTEAPEAIICGNDYTAALLLDTLLRQGVRIPDDIRIAGCDDVNYARLLAVPLTTVRQPCAAIGRCAVDAMLQRLSTPDLPGRDLLLDVEFVVRESSGHHL